MTYLFWFKFSFPINLSVILAYIVFIWPIFLLRQWHPEWAARRYAEKGKPYKIRVKPLKWVLYYRKRGAFYRAFLDSKVLDHHQTLAGKKITHQGTTYYRYGK